MIPPPSPFFLFPGTGDEEEEGLHHPSSLPPSFSKYRFLLRRGKAFAFIQASLSLSTSVRSLAFETASASVASASAERRRGKARPPPGRRREKWLEQQRRQQPSSEKEERRRKGPMALHELPLRLYRTGFASSLGWKEWLERTFSPFLPS